MDRKLKQLRAEDQASIRNLEKQLDESSDRVENALKELLGAHSK